VNCEWEGIWKEPGVCQEGTGNVSRAEFPRLIFELGCASPLHSWTRYSYAKLTRKAPFLCYCVLPVIANPFVDLVDLLLLATLSLMCRDRYRGLLTGTRLDERLACISGSNTVSCYEFLLKTNLIFKTCRVFIHFPRLTQFVE
jgi:hypothetical protein